MFLNVVKYTRNKHKYKYWLINLSLVDSIFFNWIFDFEFRFSNDDDDERLRPRDDEGKQHRWQTQHNPNIFLFGRNKITFAFI